MDVYQLLLDLNAKNQSVRMKNADVFSEGLFVMTPNVFIVWGSVSPSMLRTLESLLVVRLLERWGLLKEKLTQTEYGQIVGQSKTTFSKNIKSLVAIGAVEVDRRGGRFNNNYLINAGVEADAATKKKVVKLTGRLALQFGGADNFTKLGYTMTPIDFIISRDISDGEFSIGLAIAARTFGFGYCDLSQKEIGECIGRERDAVRRPIEQLVEKGYVEITKPNGKPVAQRKRYKWYMGGKAAKHEREHIDNNDQKLYAVLERQGIDLPREMFGEGFDANVDGVRVTLFAAADWVGVQAGKLGEEGVLECKQPSEKIVRLGTAQVEAELWPDVGIYKMGVMYPMVPMAVEGKPGTWYRFRLSRG